MLRRLLLPILIIAAGAVPFASPAEENPKTLSNLTYQPGQFALDGSIGSTLRDGLTVSVTRDGKPISGEKVFFSVTESPPHSEDALLTRKTVITGNNGTASTSFHLGNQKGRYRVEAFVPDAKGSPVCFTINAHQPFWLVFLIISLLGGLAIFLFGMMHMSDSLQKLGGHRLEELIERCTSNRFKALAAGTVVTAIIQSSSG